MTQSLTPRIDKLDKNFFINGAFDFAQRIGTSSVNTTSSAAYYIDRWASFYGSNGTVATLARGSQTPDPRFPHCIDYDFNADNIGAFLGLDHRVESIIAQELVGSPVSVSFMVNSESATRARLQVFVNRLSDNGTGAVIEYDQNLTILADSQWHLIKFENISLSSFIALGATFQFSFDQQSVIGTAKNLFITMMNLNLGPNALSFVRFARSYMEELMACQRYYRKSYDLDVVPGTAAGAGLDIFTESGTQVGGYNFEFPMRLAPALKAFGPDGAANGVYSVQTGGASHTGFTGFNGVSTKGWTSLVGGTGLTFPGSVNVHYTAEAEL